MRKLSALTVVVLLFVTAAVGYAYTGKLPANMKDLETPARVPHGILTTSVPHDTFNYGYYHMVGGQPYAVDFGTVATTPGNAWTFDHGAPDPVEGWTTLDMTDNPTAYFQQITATSWAAGHSNPVAAPIIHGTGSVWVGAMEDQAEALCWTSGLGYGNDWCQRLTSPMYNYTGSGVVNLSFYYFEDSEVNFDYGKIEVLKFDGSYGTPLNTPGFTGKMGDPSTSTYPQYTTSITSTQIGGSTFNLVFEFTSDGGWSDEDGHYTTSYGPFGVDDVALSGSVTGGPYSYNFDAGLQTWSASGCSGKGAFFHVEDVGHFTIQDPCVCRLAGNVACWSDPFSGFIHPKGQHERSESCPADISVHPGYNYVIAQYDLYAEMPQGNGTFDRVGFDYYPYLCPATSAYIWSGRVGGASFFYHGDSPICRRFLDTSASTSVGQGAQLVKLCYEVYSSCDAFAIPSTQCTGVTNATPLVDNLMIRVTGAALAPTIAFDPGTYYQDGFPQQTTLSESAPGNANIVYDLHGDASTPDLLGDSLEINGPVPTPTTKWAARMWFRLNRIGPAQNGISAYQSWKTRVTAGGKPTSIVGDHADFTWGWMDSVQISGGAQRNRFDAYFKENDAAFNPGPPPDGDRARQNGILLDQIFVPGTKIEYFVTGNFICTPDVCSYLPDTTGKNYSYFEILPSYRNVGGVDKFPCVLYVDAYGGSGGQLGATGYWYRRALNYVLNGDGSWPPANPAKFDVYNYQDASSNWNAPMFRNPSGNSGATVPELMGYKVIVVNTGRYPNGCMDWRDWSGFSDWLAATACGGNNNYQGFILQGDNVASIVSHDYPPFLNNYLGATFQCDSYNQSGTGCGPTPPDQSYCVSLIGWSGSAWQPAITIDAYGNWCPARYAFDVMGTTHGGVGNLKYQESAAPFTQTNWAEVVREEPLSVNGKYRTVVSGLAGYHETRYNTTPPPGYESFAPCPPDTTDVVAGLYNELNSAVKWTLGIGNPVSDIGFCTDPCAGLVGIEDPGLHGSAPINALNGNFPNPFNPRTEIRFSLAQAGPVQVVIYDVSGRRVRTVVSGVRSAGSNSAWWDGTDDGGHRVSAGVYWSKLTAGTYSSNKKMVVLK